MYTLTSIASSPETGGSMSMARDPNYRPRRSDEPHGEAVPSTDGRGNDPLAELARLIGQDDPFGVTGRQGRAVSRPPEPRDHDAQEAPEWLDRIRGREGAVAYDDPAGAAAQGYETHDYQAAAYQDARYTDDRGYETGEHRQGYTAEGYYDDDQGAYGDHDYHEPAPEKRRSRVMTVAAVLGLAVIGTVSIFGYRAWTSPSTTGGEPPVIKAEQAPTKVIPAATNTDSQANKQIYDRVGERVVPREEQPIDPRSAVRTPGPAGIGTGGVTGSTGSAGTPGSASSVLPPLPAPTQSATGTEPKRVKTETIRPNQPQSTSPAQGNPSPRIASTAPTAPPAPAAAPAPVMTRSIATTAPATTQAIPTGEGGSYVQVSSQLSEADAHASFKSLQTKYPSQLGDQRAVVRRVDLTDKGIGIRYRTLVGPFSTSAEAKQFCENYKSAGGKCVVNVN
jgi:sporulation related protein